jgi:hypothetical protein
MVSTFDGHDLDCQIVITVLRHPDAHTFRRKIFRPLCLLYNSLLLEKDLRCDQKITLFLRSSEM